MRRMMSIVVVSLIAVTGAAAQSGNRMDEAGKMDGGAAEGTPKYLSYTGCIEATGPGTFTLSRAVPLRRDMAGEEMPTTLSLSSDTVKLGKHVGHKVTLGGYVQDTMGADRSAMTVKSIRVVAKSCPPA